MREGDIMCVLMAVFFTPKINRALAKLHFSYLYCFLFHLYGSHLTKLNTSGTFLWVFNMWG